ncbi:MAG: phenylalanine--tRNA ligase subunit beta [Candidatus Nealsonbacteria bacterium]
MVFSYNFLQSFFLKKLPKAEKLAELLMLHSFEVEEVKKKGKDFILDIDVLPNRASDCFSHMGIAKELAVLTGFDLKVPDIKLKEDGSANIGSFISVFIKDASACQRYLAKVVFGVKVGPSPKWLKDRLATCGLRPINNIVDIANYVMLEIGQPLHAFDGDKVEGKKIIVRYARNKERIVTLDEQKFELDSDILVIADEKKPLAIAGIKGGKLPEIDSKTKIVILEAANFSPGVIRKGSQKLKLRTDASLRFEHGLDPNLAEFAINRAAFLIQKLAEGKAVNGSVDIYPKKAVGKILKLNLDYVKSLLGANIPEKEAVSILQKLDFKIVGKNSREKSIMVKVPTARLDVSTAEDLVEEIARIYGYDNIKPVFPLSAQVPPENNLDDLWQNLIKDTLKEAGFIETYNYSFFGDREAGIFSYGSDDLINLINPISVDQKYLRNSLMPNLLKNVEKNINKKTDIRIFELGKIFKKQREEKTMLSGLVFPGQFHYLKGVVDLMMARLGVAGVWYDDYKSTPEESRRSCWHPRKCAEIKIGLQEIGFLGELSPKIINSFGLKGSLVLFDIDFDKLSKFVSEEKEYRPLSKFPSSIRDISVLVPRKTKVVDVLNRINRVGGILVEDVDLFDMYEGEELSQDKKSLAFHIIYQAKNRTLTSGEVDIIQNKIIKDLEKSPGWQVRK